MYTREQLLAEKGKRIRIEAINEVKVIGEQISILMDLITDLQMEQQTLLQTLTEDSWKEKDLARCGETTKAAPEPF